MRTALVLREESELHYDYTRQPRRPVAEVRRIAIAFCDGAFLAAYRISSGVYCERRNAIERSLEPDYATIRDYLIDEANADERVAAQIALHLTAPLWRIFT